MRRIERSDTGPEATGSMRRTNDVLSRAGIIEIERSWMDLRDLSERELTSHDV